MLTKNESLSLDYVYLGAPFSLWVAPDIDTGTLDYVYLGAPYNAYLQEDTTYMELSGSIDGVSSITGDLSIAYNLSGSITGTSTLGDPNLILNQEMAGSISEASSLTGDLSVICNLEGSVVGMPSVTGDLTTLVTLEGSILGELTLTGDLEFLWGSLGDTNWNEWDPYENVTDESWIPDVDAVENTWASRSDESEEDIWIPDVDTPKDTWTER